LRSPLGLTQLAQDVGELGQEGIARRHRPAAPVVGAA
jgi:hypothetical protein